MRVGLKVKESIGSVDDLCKMLRERPYNGEVEPRLNGHLHSRAQGLYSLDELRKRSQVSNIWLDNCRMITMSSGHYFRELEFSFTPAFMVIAAERLWNSRSYRRSWGIWGWWFHEDSWPDIPLPDYWCSAVKVFFAPYMTEVKEIITKWVR